jgi:hypothetical protein
VIELTPLVNGESAERDERFRRFCANQMFLTGGAVSDAAALPGSTARSNN